MEKFYASAKAVILQMHLEFLNVCRESLVVGRGLNKIGNRHLIILQKVDVEKRVRVRTCDLFGFSFLLLEAGR
jgi:hypothetical protein